MAEVPLSYTTRTPDPFRDAPRIIIYDPGKHIRNPIKQLHPFGSCVNIYHNVKDLVNIIENSQDQQLFLVLIFPNGDDVAVKRFLMKYIPDSSHIFSLFLIFPNGLNFHEPWKNGQTLPKLRWCRSFTNRLIRDILDVCKSACDQTITFYEQRKIQAQDAYEHESMNSAASIIILFARKIEEYSNLLFHYYLRTLHTESDN